MNIVLGITGSIAAYRSLELIRILRKENWNIFPVMTKNAESFVTKLSVETLAEHPLLENTHVDLDKKADLLLVMPCTANAIAKFAHGIADDLLTSTFLNFKGKKIIIPAMHDGMYENPITQENIEKLKSHGIGFMGPSTGDLACGDVGKGRMAPVLSIVNAVKAMSYLAGTKRPENKPTSFPTTGKPTLASAQPTVKSALNFSLKAEKPALDSSLNASTSAFDHLRQKLNNKNVVVTAGGTSEHIDSVRTITNKSTGQLGKALADCLHLFGANVTLVSSKLNEDVLPYSTVTIESVDDLKHALEKQMANTDLLYMAAAVSDFKPAVSGFKSEGAIVKSEDSSIDSNSQAKQEKIKRTSNGLSLKLESTLDIIKNVTGSKLWSGVAVGFCLEDNDLIESAKSKLLKKGLNYIVANESSNIGNKSRSITILRGSESEKPKVVFEERELSVVEAAVEIILNTNLGE